MEKGIVSLRSVLQRQGCFVMQMTSVTEGLRPIVVKNLPKFMRKSPNIIYNKQYKLINKQKQQHLWFITT